MLYQLLFNTHYFLLHTSYIFIFLYFYMFLYVYLYIFLRFSYSLLYNFLYGFLTVDSLQFAPSYSCLPTANLTVGCTVSSTSFYTVGYTIFSTVVYSLHTLLSSFHTHYKSPLYSEYYLLLYLYSCSFLRFFLLVFFSHRFHSV